jgi:hypothetical protein
VQISGQPSAAPYGRFIARGTPVVSQSASLSVGARQMREFRAGRPSRIGVRTSARFRYESFQNWRNEFLAVLAIVVLTISFANEARHNPKQSRHCTPRRRSRRHGREGRLALRDEAAAVGPKIATTELAPGLYNLQLRGITFPFPADFTGEQVLQQATLAER